MRCGYVAEQHLGACICLWVPVCTTVHVQVRRGGFGFDVCWLGWLEMIKMGYYTEHEVSHLSNNKERREGQKDKKSKDQQGQRTLFA